MDSNRELNLKLSLYMAREPGGSGPPGPGGRTRGLARKLSARVSVRYYGSWLASTLKHRSDLGCEGYITTGTLVPSPGKPCFVPAVLLDK